MMYNDAGPITEKTELKDALFVIYQNRVTLDGEMPNIVLEVIKIEHMNIKDLTFTKKDSDEVFQTYRIKSICIPRQKTQPNPAFDEERIMKEDAEYLESLKPVNNGPHIPIEIPSAKEDLLCNCSCDCKRYKASDSELCTICGNDIELKIGYCGGWWNRFKMWYATWIL